MQCNTAMMLCNEDGFMKIKYCIYNVCTERHFMLQVWFTDSRRTMSLAVNDTQVFTLPPKRLLVVFASLIEVNYMSILVNS